MRLGELLRLAGLPAVMSENSDPEISGVCRDSRAVAGGELFAALSGTKDNGERYIRDAAARGAAALLVSAEYSGESCGLPFVRVFKPRPAFAALCAAFAGHPERFLRIYGITGTNGKTSTAYFLERILASGGRHTAMIGSNGLLHDGKKVPFPPENSGISQMTTPDPELLFPLLAELRSAGVSDVVMEVSSHALALGKVFPIPFFCAIYTNFASDHLDFHGSREEYKQAKLLLAAQSKFLVYNGDDPAWRAAFRGRSNAYDFGRKNGDFTAHQVRMRPGGVTYLLRSPSSVFRMRCRVDGDFTVMNSLAAAGAALLSGISPETVAEGALSLTEIPGRMERLNPEGLLGVTVLLDYAHTAEAMERLLKNAAVYRKTGRVVTVFGCGGERDREKRAVMGRAAAEGSDLVIVTTDNPRSESPGEIIGDILTGMTEFANKTVIPDRREAITAALCLARPGDTVLLVGKGQEDYEIDASGRHPYSEYGAVERAAAKRLDFLKKRSMK